MAVASAFLPWATVGRFTFTGTEGDGQITLVLGLILAVLGAVRLNGKGGKAISWVAAGVAGAIGLIGVYYLNELEPGDAAISLEIVMIASATREQLVALRRIMRHLSR
jgi:hypothetical protein